MVFYKARQEDLIEYLIIHITDEERDRIIRNLQINLKPPKIAIAK